MKLIDGDVLKSKAVPLLFPTKMEPCGHIPAPVNAVVVAEIEQAQTIDAVPVVRCKDCVNGTVFVNKQGAEYVDCVLDDYSVRKPTDYCSYGKRKECDDNG